jgi:hypothetical protein
VEEKHMLATLALVALTVAQAPAEVPKAAPMAVAVETPGKPGAAEQAWASALRSSLAARKDEFRLVKPGEKAELVVRVEAIGKAADGAPAMSGALVMGATTKPFAYTFPGDTKAQTDALARNLRKYADQMKAPRP